MPLLLLLVLGLSQGLDLSDLDLSEEQLPDPAGRMTVLENKMRALEEENKYLRYSQQYIRGNLFIYQARESLAWS